MHKDIAHHLTSWNGGYLPDLSRDNDSPLDVRSELFTEDVREALENVYARDLQMFGKRWDLDQALRGRPMWSKDAIREIHTRAAMGERIGDLALDLRVKRRKSHDLSTRTKNLNRKIERKQARIESLNRRVAKLSARPKPTRLARLERRLRSFLTKLYSR